MTSVIPFVFLMAILLGEDATPTQIDWVADLRVAQGLAAKEARPLFVAINMDGESASERIVRENYRDPEFVALTRRAICLVGSAFRHTPRDYDDAGERILCPRLGSVTCGEHIALEPILFDRFMGGDRIAPRHALIGTDGTVLFDIYLLFDLKGIDKLLAGALPPLDPRVPGGWQPTEFASWRKRLTVATDDASMEKCVREAREAGVEEDVTAEFALLNRDVARSPVTLEASRYLPALASLDRSDSTRTMVLAEVLFANDVDAETTTAALSHAFGATAVEALQAETAATPHRSVASWIASAEATRLRGIDPAPPRVIHDEADLLEDLSRATDRLDEDPDDVEAMTSIGRASLELARMRIEGGEAGGDIFLVDAANYLSQARVAQPDDVSLWLDSAKCAYFAGQLEEEERFAIAALKLLPNETDDDGPALVHARHEARRWVGDAAARLLERRSGTDLHEEALAILRGGEALFGAASSPRGDDVDFQSAASFCGALGITRYEAAWLDAGLRRFPESNRLRSMLNELAWRVRRPELSVEHAQLMKERDPSLAINAWYLGFSQMLLADWRRREENVEGAIALYRDAAVEFAESERLNPSFAAWSTFYRAMCAQSRGFAHLLANHQIEAAAALVEAVGIDPSIAGVRDGLDRETLDLIDQCLEFRIGRLSPVLGSSLAADLRNADPGNAAWERAVADSELREALRYSGRQHEDLADALLQRSAATARGAMTTRDEVESRRTLAQTTTIIAERMLTHDDVDGARVYLAEAAPLMGYDPPTPDASLDALRELAAQLREDLGEPRPIDRPGR